MRNYTVTTATHTKMHRATSATFALRAHRRKYPTSGATVSVRPVTA